MSTEPAGAPDRSGVRMIPLKELANRTHSVMPLLKMTWFYDMVSTDPDQTARLYDRSQLGGPESVSGLMYGGGIFRTSSDRSEPLYKAKTPLGERLWRVRERIVASGGCLLTWEDIEREIAESRRGHDELES